MGRNLKGYLPEDVKDKHWRHDKIKPKMAAALGSSSLDTVTVDLRPFTSPRHDQRSLGSCVAQATVKALEIKRIMKYGKDKHVDLSVLATYYLARELMTPIMTKQDSGTYISLACDALRRWGICEESQWPYNISKYTVAPPWMAMRRAYINKIDSFYRITNDGDQRLEDVLLHLHSGNPVIFGTAVTKAFKKMTKDDVAGAPNGEIVGRHAMVIVGWLADRGVFVGENSWGSDWCDDGFFYASPEFLMSYQTKDLWAVAGGWEDWL